MRSICSLYKDSYPHFYIGYTEYRTNLLGGRHPNVVTMRACVVKADDSNRRVLAEELTRKPNTWTQFAGWSPDGGTAIIGSGWESPENAAWEEKHQTFRFSEGWLYDMCLLDTETEKVTNVTAVERCKFRPDSLSISCRNGRQMGSAYVRFR